VTALTDALGRTTLYSYVYGPYNSQLGGGDGDLVQVTRPDGSTISYQYDPTFHHRTQTTQVVGAQLEVSTDSYNPTGDLLTSTDAAGATTSYTFYQSNGVSNGLVATVTTPGANGPATTSDVYDSDRRLVISFDALNVPTYYSYDQNGNPASTTDAYGRKTQTVYSGRNLLLQSIDAIGGTTSNGYAADGQQTSTTDARGFTSSTTLDQRGLVTARTDNAGVTVETDQYNAAEQLTQQTDARGDSSTFGYNVDGWQTSTTDALGNTSTTAYAAAGEVTATTDPLGRTTRQSYDLLGQVASTTDPLGRTTTQQRDQAGNVVRNTDPLGISTLGSFDLDNRLVESITWAGPNSYRASFMQYNQAGEETASIDPLGLTDFNFYNADGEQTGTKDAQGLTTGSTFDLVGNLTSSTDARGKVTNYYYDAVNNRIAVKDPDGNLTQTVYDPVRNVIQTIDAKGNVTKTSYDPDGRALTVSDGDHFTSQNSYDLMGNLVSNTDQNGKTTHNWFDALNRLFLSLDPDGHFSQTLYDAAGQTVGSVDGAGDVTMSTLDGDGEQTAQMDGNSNNVTDWGYNADGAQTSETDPDQNPTRYLTDGYGEVVGTVDPLGNVNQTVLDADGRVASITDADGRKVAYQRDKDGRVTQQVWYNADGTVQDTLNFTYDNDGNVLTASNGYGSFSMTYGSAGELLTRTDPLGLTLTYGYDQNNNVTSVQDSLGGQITNVYDGDNRETSLQFSGPNGQQARLDTTFTPDGQVATLTRYQDTAGTQKVGKSVFSYDPTGNVSDIQHQNGGGAVLSDFGYGYDQANRVSSETDTLQGTPTTTPYSYDKASQLTQAGGQTYSWDPNGNRSNYTTTAGNRLQSDGTWNYSYDNVGNTVQKVNISTGETWTYSWNDANMMTLAVDRDSHGNLIQQVTLDYDVFGALAEEDVYVQSTGQTTVTKYANDAAGDVWADLNGSNQLVMRRLYVDVNGQTQPVARIDASGNVAWYLTDHLGSVRQLVNNSGAVLDQISYDPWGNITSESSPSAGDRLKYASEPYDSALGVYHDGWRLDQNGHWLSEDPTGLAAGPNPYEYVSNDPTNAIDPEGTQDELMIDVKFKNEKIGVIEVAPFPKVTGEKDRQEMSAVFKASPLSRKETLEKLKADHFNWYQIIVADKYPAQDAKGNTLTVPHLDPPRGGYKNTGWADDLPWTANEKPAPKGAKVQTDADTFDIQTAEGAKFSDIPAADSHKGMEEITFRTWLVAVDKDGNLVEFLQGWQWEWNNKNKLGEIPIKSLKALGTPTADDIKVMHPGDLPK
jgi:RHS repeat-associated protein